MRIAVIATVACLSIVGLSKADDAKASIRLPTNIPAQNLSSALKAFAEARKLEVLYLSESVREVRTGGAVGELTTDEALMQLLSGTGLMYRYVSDKAVTILPVGGAEGSGTANPTPGGTPISSTPDSNPPNAGDSQKEDKKGFLSRFLLAQASPGSSSSASTVEQGEHPAVQGEEVLQQIVVTGSRIAQTGYNAPSPVSITTEADLERTGVSNLYDVLNRSPLFGVGIGPAQSVNAITGGEIGASFVNLRGLGLNRTLVLVDGERRVSGSSTASAVDLSTIPANMIQRIEVVTGGAAAVYGADAVSGAVNVILKDKVDGLEFDSQGGTSSQGDATTYNFSILTGGSLGDRRGHITIGASFNHEDPLFQRQRSYLLDYVNRYANPDVSPSDPYQNILYHNTRFPGTTYSGAFTIGGTQYTYDGTLRPTQNGARPLSFLGTGGGDGFNGADFNALRPETSVASLLEHMTYEVSKGVTLTSDIQVSQNHTVATQQPLFGFDYPISIDNPYIPAPVRALMNANGLTSITVGRTDVDQGLTSQDVKRNMSTAVLKLDGQITSSVAWQVYGQYGRYEDKDLYANDRINGGNGPSYSSIDENNSNFLQALDVIQGPNGPMCRSARARALGCQPLDIFGLNVATPAALAYFHYNPVTYTTNTQTVAGGQLNGGLFSLPTGAVRFSAGAEYRRETTDVEADKLDTEGLLFYQHASNLSGQFHVKEQFAEVLVPLLSNSPFAKSLDFNAAARESEYSTIGNTFTWKTGLVYAPVDDVHFRVTQSKSIRAPNLSELFNPGSLGQSAANYQDPCDATQINATPNRAANCRALGIPVGYTDPLAGTLRFVNTSGNPSLSAETSDSTTVGVVFQPHFLPGLSGSIDYYDISIKSAIDSLAVSSILNGCVDGATPNALLCSQIVRRSDNGISYVKLTPLNIGALKTRGLDVSADYRFQAGTLFGAPLRLGFSFAGTYDMTNNKVVDASHPENTLRYAGSVLDPKLRGNLTVTADIGKVNVNWAARYISAVKEDLNVPSPFYRNDNDLGARLYNDLYATYGINKHVALRAGVNNIFNVIPPLSFETNAGIGDGSIYDNIGTFFFLNLKATF